MNFPLLARKCLVGLISVVRKQLVTLLFHFGGISVILVGDKLMKGNSQSLLHLKRLWLHNHNKLLLLEVAEPVCTLPDLMTLSPRTMNFELLTFVEFTALKKIC